MIFETINERYDVTERLGVGGMGEVWRAYDRLLGRAVAIKFVSERELRETPGAEAILRDEAKAAGSLLGHPQVVCVVDLIDVSTDLHRGPALIMEYVEGCNLAEWIALHSRTLDDFTREKIGLYIGLEIIQAMQAAHRRKIWHRDIKPLNVLLSNDGRVKVADFGLARVVEAITRTHTVWGRQTPLYAAPEQWRGEKPDNNTDIYQLCATLYHLLAGQPANEGADLLGLIHWHESGTVVELSKHVPSLDPDAAAIITRGLDKVAKRRPDLWEIFDPLSKAFIGPLELHVDVEGCTDDQIGLIASITDFDKDRLMERKWSAFDIPNAIEAAQEGIAVVLLGGKSTLSRPKPNPPLAKSK